MKMRVLSEAELKQREIINERFKNRKIINLELNCMYCGWRGLEDCTVDHFCPDCGMITNYYD